MADATFEIEINDEVRKVTMYYGLLDLVCRACGDIEGALMLAMEHDLREEILQILLSERDETGKVSKPFNPMKNQMTADSANSLLEWAGAHAFDFLLKAAEMAKKTGSSHQKRLEDLQSTSNGGKD